MAERVANNPSTLLIGSINNFTNVISVQSVATFPARPRFRILIDNELMIVSRVNPINNQFTVIRGVEGTTPTSHASGSKINGVLTKEGLTSILAGDIGDPDIEGNDIFFGINDRGLFLSPDSLSWILIADNIYPNPVFSASIIKYNNQYIVACIDIDKTKFTILSSFNLSEWTNIGSISIANINSCRWFIDDVDDSLHLLYSAQVLVSNLAAIPKLTSYLYETHPLSPNLQTWASPTIITGNIPLDISNPQIVKDSFYYYLFYLNNLGYVEVARSDSITTGYISYRSGNWMNLGINNNKFVLVKFSLTSWKLFSTKNNYLVSNYIKSTDDWASWSLSSFLPIELNDILRITDIPTLRTLITLSLNRARRLGSVFNKTVSQQADITIPIIFNNVEIDELNIYNNGSITIRNGDWYNINLNELNELIIKVNDEVISPGYHYLNAGDTIKVFSSKDENIKLTIVR